MRPAHRQGSIADEHLAAVHLIDCCGPYEVPLMDSHKTAADVRRDIVQFSIKCIGFPDRYAGDLPSVGAKI